MPWIAQTRLDAGDFGIIEVGEVYPLAGLGLPDGPDYSSALVHRGELAFVASAPSARMAAAKPSPAKKAPAAKRTVRKSTAKKAASPTKKKEA